MKQKWLKEELNTKSNQSFKEIKTSLNKKSKCNKNQDKGMKKVYKNKNR